MAINKVIFGNTTLMDTTGVTVTPDKMVLGTTALSANGETITGTLGPATQSADGLMSATDKEKLDDANACAMVGPSAIASISDAYTADALDITIAIEPVQTGSGDPSPTNVRPISGWTGANVVVSPTTDAQDGTTYPISWQAEAGTVYGGTLDVTTGLLTVTMAKVNLGALDWTVSSAFGGCFASSIYGMRMNTAASICSNYKSTNTMSAKLDKVIYTKNNGDTIYAKDSTYTSAASFKTAMSGVKLVYELATPQTYKLTPTQIALLEGVNNVWADTGDTTVAYLRADSLCINRAIEARMKYNECDHLGIYIDAQGYLCQRIRSDT